MGVIRSLLEIKSDIAIGMAALLFLGLIGCVSQESSTVTPSDIPALSEGEAIAIVQTLLIQGECHGLYLSRSDWTQEYMGKGVWLVTASGFIQGKWHVFEKSQSVSIEEGNRLPC